MAKRSYKFFHIGDIHLGREFKSENLLGLDEEIRSEELWETFENSLSFSEENNLDFLLISGDLFESENINMKALDRINYIISKYPNLKIFLIFGNHDYLSDKTEYLRKNAPENLIIFDNNLRYLEIDNLRIYGFSWDRVEYKETPFKLGPVDKEYINIFLIHGTNSNNTNYLPLDIKEIENLGFDYVALGHIHDPIQVGEKSFYSGSLEPLSFNEIGYRGGIVVQLSKEELNFKFIPLAKREYKIIDFNISKYNNSFELFDELEKILKKENDNFIKINFIGNRDENIVLEDIISLINKKYSLIQTIDNTENLYNIKTIIDENKNNIIGEYFQYVLDHYEDKELETLLELGVEGFFPGDNFGD